MARERVAARILGVRRAFSCRGVSGWFAWSEILDLGGEGYVNGFDSFFGRYAERYMAADADAVAAMYEAPMLAVREGRAIHLPDKTAVREHLAGLMAAYRKAGAVRADIAALDVLALGAYSASATVRWRVLDADGGLVRDFRATYHLLRDDPTWRILSYTNHDA